jgi:hypothetical protein
MIVAFVAATLHVSKNAAATLGVIVFVVGLVMIYLSSRLYGRPKPRALSSVLTAPPIIEQERLIEVWKQIVDVQMHFNDMLMRTRNYALTLLLATLGAAGVALEKLPAMTGAGWSAAGLSLPSVLLLAGEVGLFAFYFLDRFYYHPLLVASVAKATEIEQWLFRTNPAIDLTATISTFSRVVVIRKTRWIAATKLYARNRLTWIYFSLGVLLAFLASVVTDAGAKPKSASNQITPITICTAPRANGTVAIWLARTCVPVTADSLSAGRPVSPQTPFRASGKRRGGG